MTVLKIVDNHAHPAQPARNERGNEIIREEDRIADDIFRQAGALLRDKSDAAAAALAHPHQTGRRELS